MPRRKSKDESLSGAAAALVMIFLFIIWFTPSLGAKVGYSLLLAVIVGGLIALKLMPNWVERKRFAALTIDEVDTMEGHKFERYIAALLEYQGYRTRVTPRSGDLGIDVIAEKGTERIAIQCKRYSKQGKRIKIFCLSYLIMRLCSHLPMAHKRADTGYFLRENRAICQRCELLLLAEVNFNAFALI